MLMLTMFPKFLDAFISVIDFILVLPFLAFLNFRSGQSMGSFVLFTYVRLSHVASYGAMVPNP